MGRAIRLPRIRCTCYSKTLQPPSREPPERRTQMRQSPAGATEGYDKGRPRRRVPITVAPSGLEGNGVGFPGPYGPGYSLSPLRGSQGTASAFRALTGPANFSRPYGPHVWFPLAGRRQRRRKVSPNAPEPRGGDRGLRRGPAGTTRAGFCRPYGAHCKPGRLPGPYGPG